MLSLEEQLILGVFGTLFWCAILALFYWYQQRLIARGVLPARRVPTSPTVNRSRPRLCRAEVPGRMRMRRMQRTVNRKRAYIPVIPAAIPAPAIPASAPIPATAPTKDLTDRQRPLVARLLDAGFSANEVAVLLGGDRNRRLAQIRELREQAELERIATAAAAAPVDAALLRMEPLPEAA